jgi:hypothetical protein
VKNTPSILIDLCTMIAPGVFLVEQDVKADRRPIPSGSEHEMEVPGMIAIGVNQIVLRAIWKSFGVICQTVSP